MAKLSAVLALLASTPILAVCASMVPCDIALADVPEVKWSKVNTPTEGEAGKWALASGSDVRDIAVSSDGTLYASANLADTAVTLLKSTDGGFTWSPVGNVTAAIADIAVTSSNASVVYYATSGNVYKSLDGGLTFVQLPPNPGGAGSSNVAITSISVATVGQKCFVVVGTADGDPGRYGGVYMLDESQVVPSWQNTGVGSYDVLAVAASPNFAADRQIVAVVTNGADTVVTSRVSTGQWGQIFGPAKIGSMIVRGASIAFPDDYIASAASPTLFVAVDTGTGAGDVYRIACRPGQPGLATDLNAWAGLGTNNLDVSCLAASGNGTSVCLMAGASNSNRIVVSQDSGATWVGSRKQPTGARVTGVAIRASPEGNRRGYATTGGQESAVSVSTDGGVSWNQSGLIDTQISSNSILDMAVSPLYAQDQTLFMLTWGGTHSLWRSRGGGAAWERVFSGAIPEVDALSSVKVSPKYGGTAKTLFLTGSGLGMPALWKSDDGGQTFVRRIAPYNVDAWTVVDDNNVFLGGYDGTNALVCSSGDGGFVYGRAVFAGSQTLRSIAASPAYERDKTLLVGNTTGWTFISTDGGLSFRKLGLQLPVSGAGAGLVSLAFDPRFGANKTVYAASDTASTTASQNRVCRFVIGKSDNWESIDTTLPVGSMVSQLACGDEGVLYAVSSSAVVTTPVGGGERSLNPTFSLTPTFETVINGLDNGTTLVGLWLSGNQLWSMDTTNTQLMTYIDSLSRAVTLKSPADKAPGVEVNGVRVDWKALPGATSYEWQVDDDGSFATSVSLFDGSTDGSSGRLPALAMSTTYYWRVRATQPVLSPWSTKWSFTTKLGAALSGPQLLSPEPGATGVAQKPVFQWTGIGGAESYEMMLSGDASFTNLVFARSGKDAVPATAWQGDTALDHDATYYWKVRAVGSGSNSPWSGVGAFTVQPAATGSPPPSPSSSPVSVQLTVPTVAPPQVTVIPPPAFPNWLLYIMAIGGLVLIALLAAILVVLLRRR